MPMRWAAAGEEVHSNSVDGIHRYFAEMDLILNDREFLVRDFSYADIAFYAAQFFARFLGQSPSSDLKNLERWRQRMGDRESVQRVVGTMTEYLRANGIEASV